MKKMWALMLSACLLAGVAGCGSEQQKPEGAITQKVAEAPKMQDFAAVTDVKADQKNVYAVVKAMNGSYWKEIIRGMKDGGEKLGVNVYVGGVLKDGDWEVQRDMLKDMKGKKADAIVLGPADSMGLTETAHNLRNDKLPVILVDTMLNTEDYDAAYMTNNLAAGAQMARKMVEMLKASGVSETDQATIVMHVSNLASRTISERLDSTVANWYTVAPANWKIDKKYLINYGDDKIAEDLVKDAMKNIPNLKGIFACNNSSTKVTVKTIMDAGRKDICVMGFDMSDPVKEALQNKDYHFATVVQNQYQMGYEAVKTAQEAAEGKAPAMRNVDTGITITDHSNYKK